MICLEIKSPAALVKMFGAGGIKRLSTRLPTNFMSYEEASDIIADFADSMSYERLDNGAVRELKNRIVDALGNFVESRREIGQVLDSAAASFQGDHATLSGIRASPDFASFYNTFLIRYLDFNDTYLSKEPLHPSDMLGALFALASGINASGRDLITAAAVGYDVGVRLCDSGSLRKVGVDHVVFLEAAAAAAAAKLLGLSRDMIKNAVSLAVVPNVALRETRSGRLSMWKAGAAADASRKAAFAALISRAGITGPALPFSGAMGLIRVILKEFDPSPLRRMNGSGVLDTLIKEYPAEYHAQAAIEAALRINVRPEDVQEVVVESYEAARTILADGPAKWAPENRETADHSLPFIVSVSLVRRSFWLDSYDYIRDPVVVDLMKKVRVEEVEEFTRQYPAKLPVRIRVRLKGGGEVEEFVELPKGHPGRPMSDEEVREKARRLGLKREAIEFVDSLEDRRLGGFVV